ncbi:MULTISPECIES: acyl carrier protein [unclassified Siphonobacter]|uniref:acyl carrier protein n=1 Tax=unclassified Siphonobacter TaxID=2635712 RepID=UPI0027854FFB|nr:MULTISPECIES: phosphopantetheine-binding protein [unclassified Siphonobacter]MDQ1089645.1 acyl carrier protein [Siphonobacter sp. SORGH_AS_1065]MDR6197197.1 acyl carrier protein [Siphonobacter sp. SORGH_AS_0500]
MNEVEVIERLKTIIKPYVQDTQAWEDLTPETDLMKDLKINSANLVDIVLDVEEAYNITIDNEAMERMLTVGAAMDIIREKLA